MPDRRPTPQQADTLAAIAQDRGYAAYRSLDALVRHGWAETTGAPHTTACRYALTRAGEAALADARDRAEFEAIPAAEVGALGVRVVQTKLGRGPIKGSGMRTGWSVNCWACYRAGRTRHGFSDVWKRNESGRAAKRDAEDALMAHVLAHHRGEIGGDEDA